MLSAFICHRHMAYKNSKTTVEKCSNIWTENLVRFLKRIRFRMGLPSIDKPLDSSSKMLKETAIIGRYNYLVSIEKGRKERVELVAAEISNLWKKLSFPSIFLKSIGRNIENILEKHDSYLKNLAIVKNTTYIWKAF